jgi:hypothetical protein
VVLAVLAWLVAPDNQLGETRPATWLAGAAIAVAGFGLIASAFHSAHAPRQAAALIVVDLAAIVGAVGALTLLLFLPNGN